MATAISFDPQVGIVSPESTEIRTSVGEAWQKAFNKGEGFPQLDIDPTTPAGQLVDSQTGEIEAKNAELMFLANMFNPRVSDGRFQDALGYIYYLTRKVAQATIVECQLTGLYGTNIPYGALAQTADGDYLINTGSVNIGIDGTATAYFRCTEPGPIIIDAESVTRIITVIPGWASITNAVAGVLGRNRETRAEFEYRRYQSVAKNAHGTAAAVYGAMADLNGVVDCAVLENITNVDQVKFGVTLKGHSIAVCIYGGDDADIAEVIFKKKDAGCGTNGDVVVDYEDPDHSNAYGGPLYHYQIVRPTTTVFWVQVNVVTPSKLADTSIRAIKNAVVEDFVGASDVSGNSRVGLAQTVYASRFYASVMAVDGVSQLKSVKVFLGGSTEPTDWYDVVTINANIEPTLTADNVIVAMATA